MKHIRIINLLIFTILLATNVACVRDMKVTYPETMKIDHESIYFNDTIVEPYYWLENIHSDSTTIWIKNQNELTFDYLSKIPFREKIRKDLIKIQNTTIIHSWYGNKNYRIKMWFDSSGFERDSVVIYDMDNLKDKERMVVNFGKLPEIDSIKHIVYYNISPDNRYFAYMYILPQDSGLAKIRIRDIENDVNLSDSISIMPQNCKWFDWKDDNLYYYTQQESKKTGIYSHKLNTVQEHDSLVFHYYCTNIRISRDHRYLFFIDGTNKLKIKSLNNPASQVVLIDSFKLQQNSENWQSIQNYGDDIYMFCNKNPLQNILMKINIASNEQKWETVIPESEDILTDFKLVKDKIIAHYLHNATSRLFVFDLDGKNKTELPLPTEFGSVQSIRINDEGYFFSFSSFAFPLTYYYVTNINKPKLELLQSTMPDFDAEKYITEQVWYTSKDSTKIPMFLIYKKGLQHNSKNPVLLTGYGGFGISQKPFFGFFQFIEKGGIFALANIRGGGEFGEKWHEAGMKLNKQNVFDDFIAAAGYLIYEKYTSPEKLAIEGASNGGLLVSACLVQRPELFKVVIAKNSVTDMLKSQKWEYEYGSVKNNEEYCYLREYSPLLNVKTNVHYPATMITTGMKDDIVPPWHSFKFAATLQNAQIGGNPVLLRTDSVAGHGAGTDATIDYISFIFENLKMKY